MNAFCVAELTPASNLRPQQGILRATALAVTSDALAAADRIRQDAEAEAQAIKEAAQSQARELVQNIERDTLQRADQLLAALRKSQDAFLERAEDTVIELVQAVFDRLVLEMTPQEKISAALKRILREAPPRLASPLLRVHPEDMDALPEMEWEVKPDPAITRSTCLLEAGSGEWHASFNIAADTLKTALGRSVEQLGIPDTSIEDLNNQP